MFKKFSSKQKTIVWLITIATITGAMLISVLAGDKITVEKKGYKQYVYPDDGQEFIKGPEKACYYIIYYDGQGNALYTEVIRLADNFILKRIYPNGKTEEFTPPKLTDKQINEFNKKYAPEELKKKTKQEVQDLLKQVEQEYASLKKRNLVKEYKGKNYCVLLLTKANSENKNYIIGNFLNINSSNIKERGYSFDTTAARKYIVSRLEKANLSTPIQVYIVPFRSNKYPNGLTQYRNVNGKKMIQILLFHNVTSVQKQFDIQFSKL